MSLDKFKTFRADWIDDVCECDDLYEDLEITDINDNDELFGDEIGLDSIDALELIVLLEKDYGIKITDPKEGKEVFYSVETMATYIEKHS